MSARSIALTWEVPSFPASCEVWTGEDILLTFTRAAATTISGWTITGYLRKNHDDSDPTLTISGTITSNTSGIFTLALTAAQTAALANQSYTMEIWRVDSGSNTLMSSVYLTMLEGTQT